MSNLLVQNIKHTNGTTAQTINSSGDITESNLEIDQFYLNANDGQDGDGNVLTDWTRNNFTGFTKVGTGCSVSSGVFSFPRTGLYKLTYNFMAYGDSDGDNMTGVIQVTTNNSSYTSVALALAGSGSNHGSAAEAITFVNCTDTSQVKFRLLSESMDSSSLTQGSTSSIRTHIVIERVAPAQ